MLLHDDQLRDVTIMIHARLHIPLGPKEALF